MSRRMRQAGVAGLLVLAVAGTLAWQSLGRSGPAGTARVERQDLPLRVEATGKLDAEVAFEVGPPSVKDVWNYNLQWMIPEGRWVEEGEVVARFDATEIEEQLRDYRAELETVTQEREKEQRNLELALEELRLDLVRAENELETLKLDTSIDPELVSFIEYETALLEQELAAKRVSFLREKISFEKRLVAAKLDLLDVKKSYAREKIERLSKVRGRFDVEAPIAGLVVYVPKRNGDRWEVGESVWMMAKIMKIADTSTLRVEAAVLEADASRIRPGQPARVTLDALPGVVLETEVAGLGRIVRERSPQDRSKVFDVFLPVERVDRETMRPGMGVHATIETERLEDRLTVPLGAVRPSAEGPFVEVRVGGRTERRPVALGERSGDRVVVVEGLSEGDEVMIGSGAEARS